MRFFKTVCFLSFLAIILAPMVALRASETVDSKSPRDVCREHALSYKETALKRDQGTKAQELIELVGMAAQQGAIDGPTTAAILRMIIAVYSQPELAPQDFYEAAWKECAAYYGIVES